MPVSPSLAHHRARRANAVRRGDTPAADEAGRALRAAKLAEYIKRTVDEAPPLTVEQRDRLALLLHPSGGGQRAS